MSHAYAVTTHDYSAEPFPHLIVDGWFDDSLLTEVLQEFPDADDFRWLTYANDKERKLEGPESLWGRQTRELFQSIESRVPYLESVFGISGLTMETVGGGYHATEPGGYLDVHTDFSRSPATGRYRRLNFLVYLNRRWEDAGGQLELWDDKHCVVRIYPEFNRTVVFESTSRSWHGHPRPAQRWRRSVAAYFFTNNPPEGYREQSTVWHSRSD